MPFFRVPSSIHLDLATFVVILLASSMLLLRVSGAGAGVCVGLVGVVCPFLSLAHLR